MPIIFSMTMCIVDLIVVVSHPTVMLHPHVFPYLGFFEVKVSHSSLNIERRLNIAHPGLSLLDAFLADFRGGDPIFPKNLVQDGFTSFVKHFCQ
jgi:hypothetical protein